MRFHSCTTESLVTRPSSAPTLDTDEDVFPTKDLSTTSSNTSTSTATSTTINTPTQSTPAPMYHSTPLSSLPPSTRLLRDEHKENTPPYSEGEIFLKLPFIFLSNKESPPRIDD